MTPDAEPAQVAARPSPGAGRRTLTFVVAGLLVAAVLAFAVSRVASSEPDGLERVAADQGLDAGGTRHALADGPLADYQAGGIDDPATSTGVAGLIGVGVTFVAAGGLAWVAGRRARRPAPS